jgi:catechol 2,3-dioxygenase-like lactoylglutathione lyase family enzyme
LKEASLKIKLASVFVDDQEKALNFYTKILGFAKKTDVSAGQYRWLTVVSPEGSQDIELVLEPNANPAAATYQKAIHDQGIPATMFFVDDIHREYKRLQDLGVSFRGDPTQAGPAKIAIFDDTCGNLIQIAQV